MTRFCYFSRCNGAVVMLASVGYSLRGIEAVTLAYPEQVQFVRDTSSRSASLAAVLADTRQMYLYACGVCESCGETHPVDRIVDRGLSPSGHLCDARCRFAKGHLCECSCGGRWHGAGDLRAGQSHLFADPSEVAA